MPSFVISRSFEYGQSLGSEHSVVAFCRPGRDRLRRRAVPAAALGQLGIAQLVALLLISNAVQNAMNGGDNSITGGLVLAVVLILLSYVVEVLTYRSKRIENVIQGRPTLLVHHGKVLAHHLKRELLSERELHSVLRRQGIHHLDEIEEAVLESDGYLSVIRKPENRTP